MRCRSGGTRWALNLECFVVHEATSPSAVADLQMGLVASSTTGKSMIELGHDQAQRQARRTERIRFTSASFMSFTRHEYFRRILCNLLGTEMESGLLPKDMGLVGSMVERVCYGNAKEYLELPVS